MAKEVPKPFRVISVQVADDSKHIEDQLHTEPLPDGGCPIEAVEAVYRRLDLRIIPAFWVLYFLCSAIRSNIGLAQTMNTDQGHALMSVLHLTSRDASTALSLFYVSYIIFDFPSNLAMSRLSPRVCMAGTVFAVGSIGMCFAAVTSAWSLKFMRFLLGAVSAGIWPGMSYYLTLFYPPSRTGKRIGMYFSAAQVSAAVVGLVGAGFQKMDGLAGLVGFQWMFLAYGALGAILGLALLWWLPDRPLPPGQKRRRHGLMKFLPAPSEALKGEDAIVHYQELRRAYHPRSWTWRDLGCVLVDWRLVPLVLMYFGIVSIGVGAQLYGNVIIAAINPEYTDIQVSLLFATIWIMDFFAVLIVSPISDRFHRLRPCFFSCAVLIQIAGLLTVTFALSNAWARYGGLLLFAFALGPTVPICMTWTNEIFQARHGEVGVAAATAVVSGLGNLGSVATTYALYTGWPADSIKGPYQYRRSNLTMIGILCVSIANSIAMTVLIRIFGNKPCRKMPSIVNSTVDAPKGFQDGAARRELDQRGFGKLWWTRRN